MGPRRFDNSGGGSERRARRPILAGRIGDSPFDLAPVALVAAVLIVFFVVLWHAFIMLYIGTDDGLYRWFHGTPWPIFHSLQGRSIVGLASPGGGVLVALDGSGRIWESVSNGLDWRSIPLPEGAGRPTCLALLDDAEVVVATARPLGLHRRPIGQPTDLDAPSPLAHARRIEDFMIGRARSLASRVRGASGRVATLDRPSGRLSGWTPMALPSAESGAIAPSIRLLTSGPGGLFAAVAGAGLWTSPDLGASWARLPGLPDEVHAVRFAATLILAGTADGLWTSGDGGQTWADSGAGLEKARQVRAVEVKPGDPKTLLVGAAPKGAGEGPVADRRGLQFALYESKDAGKTWKHVTRGFPEVLESDSIVDIRYLPEAPDHAAIALNSGEMWNTSVDGAWWEPLARQIRSARVLCVTR